MKRHPVEQLLNAPAEDILSAIQHGFRAIVDVKGKLAEYYLYKKLTQLAEDRMLDSMRWQDKDGQPDFVVSAAGRELRVECKNVRSKQVSRDPLAYKVELQKTRNSKDGTPTRGYRGDEFDVLAVCLFNQTREWRYLYAAAPLLQRRPDMPGFLAVMQRVPPKPEGIWRPTIQDAIADAVASK